MPQAMDLAIGFPDAEKTGVMDFLLARPWQELLNAGLITERGSNGFFGVTEDGYAAAVECASSLPQRQGEGAHQRDGALTRRDKRLSGTTPRIFISHSSNDEDLAAALIDLLQSALPDLWSDPNPIRCTSVPGYKLEGGADTDTVLREEIRDADVFIGLLTPKSLNSTYVLFELGARWGLQTVIKPLISGFPKSDVKAPLSRLHIQSCDEPNDLHQLLSRESAIGTG